MMDSVVRSMVYPAPPIRVPGPAPGSGEDEGGDGHDAERGRAHDLRCPTPHCLEGGSSPYVHSTVLDPRWLVNQVTIPSRMRLRYSNA